MDFPGFSGAAGTDSPNARTGQEKGERSGEQMKTVNSG